MRKNEFIEQKKKELEGYERILNTRILVRLDTRAVKQAHVFERLLEKIEKLSIDQQDERSRDRIRIYDDFIASLKFPEITSRQEHIPAAYRDTFEWIFQDPGEAVDESRSEWANFAQWLKTGNATYWIHGKPGSGNLL